MNKKIVFFKSVSFDLTSTESFALKVLSDPKYDAFPNYIEKEKIQEAFDLYGYKLNPFNSDIYAAIMNSPNIEGHFLSENIPEIDTMVVDQIVNKRLATQILDKNDDITTIALSSYAMGMENTIDLIKYFQKHFSDKELLVGGIGVLYPHIKNLVLIEDLCYGNGVNWLRTKLNLPRYSHEDYRIPLITSNMEHFPGNLNTAYLVSQIGCPFQCDFCITNKFLDYNPVGRFYKIINFIDNIRASFKDDTFLFICDPNAFYPESLWKRIFDYYVKTYAKYDNIVYIICLASLKHVNSFNLKKIQRSSALKLFLVNFGLESTLKKGYIKNKGVNRSHIERLKECGIIAYHNFILGLPHHTKDNISKEISNNLEFESTFYSINTLKPLPTTDLYIYLKNNKLLFGEDLPSELLYRDGFFPFFHKKLGKGFSALKYAFKAYFECEKKVIDVYMNFIDTLKNIPDSKSFQFVEDMADSFLKLSSYNFKLFKPRMVRNLTDKYLERYHRLNKIFK
ncbi:MAG: hypothetical protein GF317_18105 [Candidatus Lokiarchaeota archaeon]|nr:hypothetical protein [Candidatus Lokiarchaeota archaeon]MBD3201427.1 hypothetical protein [Candidatus Lokiarchaeota archaeon]